MYKTLCSIWNIYQGLIFACNEFLEKAREQIPVVPWTTSIPLAVPHSLELFRPKAEHTWTKHLLLSKEHELHGGKESKCQIFLLPNTYFPVCPIYQFLEAVGFWNKPV